MTTTAYLGTHRDVHLHLAFEEYLLDRVRMDEQSLYLWQSRDSVVIGKNQNPWLESNVNGATTVFLSRRISGGGTVFHDEGNLNFTFISHRDNYDFRAQSRVIRRALASLGVPVRLNRRRAFLLQGRKCSGSAFFFRRSAVVYHGTLLVHTDIAKMNRYLRPQMVEIKTPAIRSVPSVVVNVADEYPAVTIDLLCQAIIDEFSRRNKQAFRILQPITPDGDDVLEGLLARYRSWEWIYGRTPRFHVCFPVTARGARVVWRISVAQGRIQSLVPDGHLAAAVPDGCCSLVGQPFDPIPLRRLLAAQSSTVFP